MITILHNQRCSKSRCAIDHLNQKGIEYKTVKYLEDTPSADELKEILSKLGKKPLEIIRKSEAIFKDEYKGKELSDDEWVEAMVKNPKLIERPIIINGDKAVIARPTELIDTII